MCHQEEDGHDFWFKLDDEVRGQIKEALFNLLGHQTASVVKDAGVCLGIIATIELPIGQWPEFLNLMASNATNDDYKFRLAAVQTLGQTMEFIELYGAHLNNQ